MNEEYAHLLQQTQQYAVEYLNDVNQRPVYPDEFSLSQLEKFEEPLPEKGMEATEVIKLLHEAGSNATTAQNGGRYFGFVNGGLLPVAHAAEWIADTWNQNGALYAMSPITSKLEDLCERWIVDLLGLPNDTSMGLVTGSANSLICALTAARNELLKRQGYNISQKGLRNAPPIKIVIGAGAHSTVRSALFVLGIGSDEIEVVPTDNYGRMKIECLPQLDSCTLFILQAGHVSGGSYDPIKELCNIANASGAWVHIDGAFGLWAAASRKHRHLVEGLENADSYSVDAHKTLNAGYDCGLVLCRHKEALVSALQADGSYIQYGENRDGMLYTTEMSRRARGVSLWAVLKQLGAKGVEQLVDQLCANAEYFSEQLQKAGFILVNPVIFNQFMVKCSSPEQTEKVLKYIQNSGVCWCSSNVWEDELVIRISVCSHTTTHTDIDQSVLTFRKALSDM